MDYLKINKNGYNLHFIKTDKFKTITIRVNFKSELTEEKITTYELLSGVLSNSTGDYPTLKELVMKKEDMYQLGYGFNSMPSGKYMVLAASTKFIHEKYTEDDMNLRSIRFFLNSIFKPNLDGKAFNKEAFDLEKRDYLEYLEEVEENPSTVSCTRFNKIFGADTTLAYDRTGDILTLKNITNESLYDTYLDAINNSEVDIFFIGNMDVNELEGIFDEYFSNRSNISYDGVHDDIIKIGEEVSVVEKSKFKQSKLCMGFVIEPMTLFEKMYVLPVYNFIFGGDSDSLLFKNVREKNSLCYDIHSNFIPIYSAIRVFSGIEAKDYERCVSLVKEMHQAMIDGKFTDADIEKVKLNYKASYLETMDSPSSILNTYEAHVYIGYDLLDERIKNIDKVDKKMIEEFASKVHYQTTYFLEGNDEKRD